MRDSEIVASIVAGDPEGLAAAYDRYADPLYTYCRAMLSDPAGAADAVEDTFVIAASRLRGLHDPERLCAWLYSVARNECLRILRSTKSTSALDEAPDVTDEVADVSGGVERAALRMLFEEASHGLNPGEREAIELHLRQILEPAEVAAVLGVSANHAHSLLTRAHDQLEACLGVLLTGRADRGDCSDLSGMFTGWDGRLTAPLRKRVHRHIEYCGTCTVRRAYELRPANLYGLSASAALAAGAAESFRVAAGAPASLRGHTLALACGQGPTAAAHQAVVLGRAGSFGQHGFPTPLHRAGAKTGLLHGARGGLRSSPRKQAAAAVVLAGLAAAVVFALTGNSGHVLLAGGKPPTPASPAVGPNNPAGTPPTSPSATSGATLASLSPKPTASTTARPAPSPTTTGPATTSASSPHGTLSVSGANSGNRLMIPPSGTQISLVASGGPVDWSITVSGDPGHHITASPSAGTLANGASVQVDITADQQVSGATLAINPGGTVYAIKIVGRHG